MLRTTLCVIGVIGTAVAAQQPDAIDGVDGHSRFQVNVPVLGAGPSDISFTKQYGLEQAPAPSVRLPELNLDLVYQENQRLYDQGQPYRAGKPRPVQFTMADGLWVAVPDGLLWRMNIECPDAMGLRVFFKNADLPKGAALLAVAGDMEAELTGPWTGRGPFDHGRIWSGSVWTNTIRVEYFHPNTADSGKPPAELPFEFDEILHYFENASPYRDDDSRGAGDCHNVPSCYEEWEEHRKAIARIYMPTGSVCSGQLLATFYQDETPYYHTAAHCVSTQNVANGSEFQFGYERLGCTGSIVPGTAVQGADLIDTYGNSDNTLLLIRNVIPNDSFFGGWFAGTVSSNTPMTGIHHPGGDYMRISFGNVRFINICGSTSTYYHGVQWNDGVTEGGSSGSPYLLNSDHRSVGVLTCGSSSCDNPSGYDGYGRFDKAFTTGGFNQFLLNGPDDDNEDNDTCEEAATIAAGNYTDQIVKSTDEDWYRITLAPGGFIDVDLTFTDPAGNINMELYAGCDGPRVKWAESFSNNESLQWTHGGSSAQEYFLRIYLYDDTLNEYSMSIDYSAPPEPPANDVCTSPEALVIGHNSVSTTDATSSGPDEPDACNSDGDAIDSDTWYSVTAPGSGEILFSLTGSSGFAPKTFVHAACPTGPGEYVTCAEAGDLGSIPCSNGDTFLFRIGTADSATGNGSLFLLFNEGPEPCPADCGNSNGVIDVDDLLALIGQYGTADGCDIDGSGLVDVNDLLSMLGVFGDTCE
ncbi:MAG: hypothetical protein VX527_05810 [Planctomycetota bacterium]|nr:hypothetical protein [Planctomycetota bacterium]